MPPKHQHELYSTWRQLKMKCTKPYHHSYNKYGAKGIKVCDEWDKSFEAFVNDMGDRPKGHRLYRIDSNGNYSPENCMWTTYRRTNRIKDNTLYSTWQQMRFKCSKLYHKSYKIFGGLGITVCDEWDNSFEAFLNDMGERPAGYTLDRIDNDGDYTIRNCKWSSKSEQQANKRTSLKYRDNVDADYSRLVEQAYDIWGGYLKTDRCGIKVGKLYGKLLVVTRVVNQKGFSRFACVCACGKIINVAGGKLSSGRQISCGCTPNYKE